MWRSYRFSIIFVLSIVNNCNSKVKERKMSKCVGLYEMPFRKYTKWQKKKKIHLYIPILVAFLEIFFFVVVF